MPVTLARPITSPQSRRSAPSGSFARANSARPPPLRSMCAPKRAGPNGNEDPWRRLLVETQSKLDADEEWEWAARLAQAKAMLDASGEGSPQLPAKDVHGRPRAVVPPPLPRSRSRSPALAPAQPASAARKAELAPGGSPSAAQDEEQEWQALRARALAAEEQEWALRIARAKARLAAPPSPQVSAVAPPLRNAPAPRLIAIWP